MYAAPVPITKFQTDREEFQMGAKTQTPAKKSTSAKAVTMTLDHHSDTKNMVRYVERGQEDRPVNQYLRKDQAAALGNPEAITVTISAA